MKRALSENGRSIPASPNAPRRARCPHCGGVVTLRSRKRMGGGVAYFWRHQANRKPGCHARVHPHWFKT